MRDPYDFNYFNMTKGENPIKIPLNLHKHQMLKKTVRQLQKRESMMMISQSMTKAHP